MYAPKSILMAWDCQICGRRVEEPLITCVECGVHFCKGCRGEDEEDTTTCIDCWEEDQEEEE